MVIPNLKFSEMGGGGEYSGLQFQKGVNWRIWTKIYGSARNLLVHHSSLSHTTYVETNKALESLSVDDRFCKLFRASGEIVNEMDAPND